MRVLRCLGFAGVLAFSTAGVLAADTIVIPTSTPAALPVHTEDEFNWSGFYAGIYGAVDAGDAGTSAGIGIQAGVNAQFDFYLVGAEVAVEGLTGGVGGNVYGQILGRAGLVATDDVLVYAAGGYGIDVGEPNTLDVLAGGGLELAISDAVSLQAEYLHSFPIQGGTQGDQISLGANFHF